MYAALDRSGRRVGSREDDLVSGEWPRPVNGLCQVHGNGTRLQQEAAGVMSAREVS